ncbi:phosphotidylinositol phosphatase PTPRQ-like, partial [Tropilaelaps mercedesae]
MELKVAVWALCCTLATASNILSSWPGTLTARLGNSSAAYVDIELSWDEPSPCLSFYNYDVYISSGHQPDRRVGDTMLTNFTIRNAEYWMNYTVTVVAMCIPASNISTTIETGPGDPHKVSNVTVQAGTVNATITFTEASSMPKSVDFYNITVCMRTNALCHWKILTRNAPNP